MFKKLLLLLAFVSCLFACSPTNYTNGVPNLVQVHSELWRSGQPTTDAQWQYLYSLGIRHVVKLNFNSEASDDGATKAGLDVHVLSVQPEGDKDIWSNITNTFVEPDGAMISQAEVIIASGGGVLVHCTHGQDRTGLVIGISRLLYDGYTKEQAWDEMLDRGFHPALLGLVSFWLDYEPVVVTDGGS